MSNDGTSPDGVDGSDFINEQSKFEKQAAEEGNSDDTGKQPNRLDEFLQDDDAIDQVSNQIKLSLEEKANFLIERLDLVKIILFET